MTESIYVHCDDGLKAKGSVLFFGGPALRQRMTVLAPLGRFSELLEVTDSESSWEADLRVMVGDACKKADCASLGCFQRRNRNKS